MFSWIAVSISASCFATRRARETAGLILSTIACKLGAGIFSFEQAADLIGSRCLLDGNVMSGYLFRSRSRVLRA
jgi:hypothetical protein